MSYHLRRRRSSWGPESIVFDEVRRELTAALNLRYSSKTWCSLRESIRSCPGSSQRVVEPRVCAECGSPLP